MATNKTSLDSERNELKQQGVVEASRDPESGVPAEAAEKAMVEQSMKAGTAAYQFDPDATPEQKDAQVKAVGAS